MCFHLIAEPKNTLKNKITVGRSRKKIIVNYKTHLSVIDKTVDKKSDK